MGKCLCLYRRYITDSKRIAFEDETKLNMDAEEQQTYLQQRQSSHAGASSSNQTGAVPSSPGPAGASPGPTAGPTSASKSLKGGSGYHFICECFFLTAKSLKLGLIKAINEAAEVQKVSMTEHPLIFTGMSV